MYHKRSILVQINKWSSLIDSMASNRTLCKVNWSQSVISKLLSFLCSLSFATHTLSRSWIVFWLTIRFSRHSWTARNSIRINSSIWRSWRLKLKSTARFLSTWTRPRVSTRYLQSSSLLIATTCYACTYSCQTSANSYSKRASRGKRMTTFAARSNSTCGQKP